MQTELTQPLVTEGPDPFAEFASTPKGGFTESLEITPIEQTHYVAEGSFIEAGGPQCEVYAPFELNGEKVRIGSYPSLTTDQSLRALRSAVNAYDDGLGPWPMMSPEERIACVEDFVASWRLKRETTVKRLVFEIAKPIADAYKEFDRTIEYAEKTIEEYRRLLEEDRVPKDFAGGLTAHIERSPIGVALCMGPFNYPLNETFTTLIPALLAGNTIVMKPAKYGVLLFEPLLESLRDCFPKGVVNVIYGDGETVITPILKSGEIVIFAFIGSTKVAKILERLHPEPQRLVRLYGMAAHNPALILPETDIDSIMPEVKAGAISFNGQRCTTLALHFAHESLSEPYARAVAKEVEQMKVGLPTEEGVQITALVEGQGKIRWMKELIEDAVSKGAKIMNKGGGEVRGNIMIPAVLFPVTSEMRIFGEEQFGPIIPIAPYNDLDQTIRAIAKSRARQQLSIFGPNEEVTDKLAMRMRNVTGRINLQAQCQRGPDELPFAGKGDAALGVQSIRDNLIACTVPTVISRKRTAA